MKFVAEESLLACGLLFVEFSKAIAHPDQNVETESDGIANYLFYQKWILQSIFWF